MFFVCVQGHADDADVTDDRSFFSFSFCYPFLFVFLPFVIPIRRAKILIRGHLHHLRHPRAIKHRFARKKTSFSGRLNVVSFVSYNKDTTSRAPIVGICRLMSINVSFC